MPAGGLAARDPFTDQPAADTHPLAVRQHRDRAERQRRKRRLQPREHGMAGDSFALNSDQRENGIACSAQIVDQVRFGGLEECGLFNETDPYNVAWRFRSDNHSLHQHRLHRGRRLAQARQEAFDHLG